MPAASRTAAAGAVRPRRRSCAWRMLLGLALVGTVITVALGASDLGAFARILQQAQPWWLLVAVALQVGTYVAEGQGWRRIAGAAGIGLGIAPAAGLSLAKLFVDQAVPSAGLSGTLWIGRSLELRGMSRAAVTAGIVIDSVTYHATYVVCLAAAVLVALAHGHADAVLLTSAALFSAFALGFAAALLALAGRRAQTPALAPRFGPVRRLGSLLQNADAQLVRRADLMAWAAGCQLAVFVLDAATVWVLVRALGAEAPITGVFASYMVATLLRTVGIVPGGLGTFEAASVLTLRLAGTDVAVALSATLLYRCLSFWLPLLPGMWLSAQVLMQERDFRGTAVVDAVRDPSAERRRREQLRNPP